MIIITGKPGQLGNMLFLFAHFIAFGKEKNISIKAPAFEEYAGYFDTTRKSLIPAFPKSNSAFGSKWLSRVIFQMSSLLAKIIRRSKLNNSLFSCVYLDWNESCDLDGEANLRLFNSHYTFVQGWLFRSNVLIQKHKSVIIDFFKPAEGHLLNINRLLQSRDEIIVGIHIRQGDYKTFEGGKYFFEIQQYVTLMKKAMTLLQSRKVWFLICSNSNLSHDAFSEIPHTFSTGKEIEDLYAFSKCNYLIGPPSTFTMWASFYGNVPLYQVHNPELSFTLQDFKVKKN